MTVFTQTYPVEVDAGQNPEQLTLTSPWLNFTVARWVVISNLTPYIANLTNVDDTGTNVPALAPNTANRYPWTNARGPIVVSWTNPLPPDTAPPSAPNILVEFSDDPTGADLPGAYPAAINSGVNIGTITGPVTLSGPITGTVDITGPVSIDAIGENSFLGGGAFSPVAGQIIIPNVLIPPSVRTFIMSLSQQGELIYVIGDTTGIAYYGPQSPYIDAFLGTSALIVTPVIAVADSSVTVTINTSEPTIDINMWGDTAQYDESILYNGYIKSVAYTRLTSATGVTLLSGPARLLSASISVDVGGGTAQLLFDGIPFLDAAAQATPAANGTNTTTFPPNTLLPTNSIIEALFTGGATADFSVMYAYP